MSVAADNPLREQLRIIAQLQPAGPRTITATTYGVGNQTVYNGGYKPKEPPKVVVPNKAKLSAREARLAYARAYYHANKDKWDEYHRHRKAAPGKERKRVKP